MIKHLKNTLVFLKLMFLLNCSGQNVYTKELNIKLESKHEFFYYFKNTSRDTLKFKRRVEIIKNEISDTIIFGNSILKPNYTGFFEYTKFKDKSNIDLNLKYDNPPADRICVSSFNNKMSKGTLVIELVEIRE